MKCWYCWVCGERIFDDMKYVLDKDGDPVCEDCVTWIPDEREVDDL